MNSLARFFRSLLSTTPPVPGTACRAKIEAYQLTTDELLKRMPKEQAIVRVQAILTTMEESVNDPDIPAARIRLEKVLAELKQS
jgi:uncharacterized protein (UPF0147 family)